MAIANTTSQSTNTITGTFGTGQVQFFPTSGTWTVPVGIGKCRVRVWGAGGGYSSNSSFYGGGGGGGFAIKTIYGFDGVSNIAVTVGTGGSITPSSTVSAGTSSFGSYVSATGGSYGATTTTGNVGGTGIGGDINYSGGQGGMNTSTIGGGGGGVASILGNGGNGAQVNNQIGGDGFGGAGGGSSNIGLVSAPYYGGTGGFGNKGAVCFNPTTGIYVYIQAQSGIEGKPMLLDMIGTGGGGSYQNPGMNGGGGGYNSTPGYPGGGAGYGSSFVNGYTSNLNQTGQNGLVIVEW